MLWLSGVVVDQTFTLWGVDMHASLLVTPTYVFIRMLKFRGWSQLRNFQSMIPLMYMSNLCCSMETIWDIALFIHVSLLGLYTCSYCKMIRCMVSYGVHVRWCHSASCIWCNNVDSHAGQSTSHHAPLFCMIITPTILIAMQTVSTVIALQNSQRRLCKFCMCTEPDHTLY